MSGIATYYCTVKLCQRVDSGMTARSILKYAVLYDEVGLPSLLCAFAHGSPNFLLRYLHRKQKLATFVASKQ